ncbi:MAG: HipA domain protein, partial [Phenylobacterium sp.]|nr:HipA domain protein [Phenylobacterium sp.]
MPDVEVHIELGGGTRPVGLLRRHAARAGETITFEYDREWLAQPRAFSLEPAL